MHGSAAERPGGKARCLWAVGWGCLAGLLLAVGAQASYIWLSGNFHTVVAGRVYRCAQLSGPTLERTIRAHGIQTVINLRGREENAPWYEEECRTTRRLGVMQEDVGLYASRLPWPDEIRVLLDALDRSPSPLLIHCGSGMDRAGLASAVVLLLQTDAGLAEARGQLTLRYGHLPWGSQTACDQFLDLYAEWLQAGQQQHSPAAFRHWLECEYCPGPYRATVEPLDLPAQVACDRPVTAWVRVHNTSVRPWQLSPCKDQGFHLHYVLLDAAGHRYAHDRCGLFDAVVAPGQSIDLSLPLPAIKTPGRYLLTLDMVHERHYWFEETGVTPFQWQLEVR